MATKLIPPPTSHPHDLLDEWVGVGLIGREQAERIHAYERDHGGRELAAPTLEGPGLPGPSLVVEALGYLGGAVMLAGATVLAGFYWQDVPVALRLVLLGVTTLTLVGGGFAVPDRASDAAGRLRAVLWAGSVVAAGAFFAVLSTDVLDRHDEDALIVIGPATAVVAAALWWTRRTGLQLLALLVPLVLSAAAVGLQVGDADTAPGISVWVLGVAWTAAAWLGWLQPRVLGVALGGIAAIFGAQTASGQLGVVLGLTTALAMLVLALWARSLPWLGVAALGMLWTAPRAMFEWFPGRLSASLTLIATGALLIAAAVWVARHQAGRDLPPALWPAAGIPPTPDHGDEDTSRDRDRPRVDAGRPGRSAAGRAADRVRRTPRRQDLPGRGPRLHG